MINFYCQNRNISANEVIGRDIEESIIVLRSENKLFLLKSFSNDLINERGNELNK